MQYINNQIEKKPEFWTYSEYTLYANGVFNDCIVCFIRDVMSQILYVGFM